MLLTITTTATPATDLGFLLHKHPDRAQSFEQSFGTAHVFYPEASEERCTAALMLEVDPRSLLRSRTSVNTPDFALAQYVNDRPGWLAAHPERGWITRRYLNRRDRYVRTALTRLAEADDRAADEEADDPASEERGPALAEQRAGAVLAVLEAEHATSVIDLGCGSGALLDRLVRDRALERITGVDVSTVSLERAHRRVCQGCHPDGRGRHRPLPGAAGGTREGGRPARPELLVGSVVYRDARFAGHDAAVLMEVVEHLDPSRLPAMEESVFGAAQPRVVVVTTPNAEYNGHYEGLPEGAFRHADHRFEWTRAEFTAWAEGVASRRGYRVRFLPVGPEHPETGAPTQMGVFTR
ncbi:3' terminal RNA ribose 2'-O-methyltransferase Hen1 [Nocardiopsis sp. CNR-923]|uniref:methyltransferase domain-containing protein n=1 Tax=Nocardiopsis sp. CNR-923 TaxID=1904965 RepID=UPI00095C87CF|nr:methyltransferase domain-containing protein [Nocardiopsis sp. CNR-923]OLT25515.1 3' terminal RNA ribose 2'-O-methyltransferase Hen1 [Nocardiopsis sp. CNR-923]